MTDRTTIQIKSAQKEQLDELKRVDGEAYHSVLAMLIANYNNQDSETIDDYSLEYDDVKAACKAALNDELPEHAFR